jgi:DNA repair protein RadC
MTNSPDSIKEWPGDDRPREKLLRKGEHTLSDAELLAILLRTGVRGASALDLARKVLQKFGTFREMSHTDDADWREFKGLGPAKICQIKAALEIGRRFLQEGSRERPKVSAPADIVARLMPRMRDLKHEVFWVILLDSRNRIIKEHEIEEGSVNQAYPVIRTIFHKAFSAFAPAIICVHNHPSGDPKPSREDREFTRKLLETGKTLQVKLLDHLIFGDNTHFSFADAGELE